MKDGLSNIMKQAQKMQENIQKAQDELAKMTVTGTAGANLVSVVMTGRYDVRKVTLAESLKSEDLEMIEDLIAAAVNDAVRKVESQSKGKMTGLMAGLNLPDDLNLPTT